MKNSLGPYVIFIASEDCGCLVAAQVIDHATDTGTFTDQLQEWRDDGLVVTVSPLETLHIPWKCPRHAKSLCGAGPISTAAMEATALHDQKGDLTA